MAAKRLGAALTNITGTSNQLLRVKSDESGFEFVSPSSIPAYTITNETTDRVMDADDVTLDELADVLGTLIEDLSSAGLSAGMVSSARKWTSSSFLWSDVNGTTQTYNHNLGVVPDFVRVRRVDAGVYLNAPCPDHDYYGTTDRTNYAILEMSSTQIRIEWLTNRMHGNSTNWVVDVYAFANTAAVPFQWSTSEQVYPFEKGPSGEVLYCKEVSLGSLPNNTSKEVDHNISSLNVSKVWKLDGRSYDSSNFHAMPQGGSGGIPVYIALYATSTKIGVITATNMTALTGYARIIYWK